MKVFLDHERPAPPGWLQAYWVDEAIAYLKTGNVTDISLAYDVQDEAKRTGYDVVLWIEQAVISRGFKPPRITVHAASESERRKMDMGIRSIEEWAGRRADGQ